MKLMFKAPFADYFQQKICNSENRGLIGRMQGLEVNVCELLFTAKQTVVISVHQCTDGAGCITRRACGVQYIQLQQSPFGRVLWSRPNSGELGQVKPHAHHFDGHFSGELGLAGCRLYFLPLVVLKENVWE